MPQSAKVEPRAWPSEAPAAKLGPPFFTALLGTFVVLLPMALAAVQVASGGEWIRRFHFARPKDSTPPVVGVPAERLDYRATHGLLRWRRQWALFGPHGTLVGVRLREDPARFSEAYPGYPDRMRADDELWTRYFARKFNYQIRVPSLGASVGYELKLPSDGCYDIFGKYGADRVVFGNSETFLAVIPAALDRPGSGPIPRTLFCTELGGTMTHLRVYAEYLRELAERRAQGPIAHAVIGYSFWWAARMPRTPAERLAQLEARLAELRAHDAESPRLRELLSLSGPTTIGAPLWDTLVPWNLTLLRAAYRDERGRARGGWKRSGDLKWGVMDTGFAFDDSDRPRLAAIAAAAGPFSVAIDPEVPACGSLEQAAVELDEALSALRRIAKRIDIFLTPVSPSHLASAPCVVERVKKLLLSRADDRVRVRVDEGSAHGLTFDDYVVPRTGNDSVLVVNHLNAGGAAKFSRVLGDWLRSE